MDREVSDEKFGLMTSTCPIITFTSDFGSREYYVGAVKGAILSVCPEVKIVDISHEVASHDLLEAAFTLLCAYAFFPCGTIHLMVVDPGVGSRRRALIVSTDQYNFIAPDNGVLSLVCQRERVKQIISIETENYFRKPVATTFHGRDIFGPVAAWMAQGVAINQFGPEVREYVRLSMPNVQRLAENRVEGTVLHVDRFGNIITSLSPRQVATTLGKESEVVRFRVDGKEISDHYRFYAEASPQEAFSLLGSSGYYEIVVQRRSAAELLGVGRGARVVLEVK